MSKKEKDCGCEEKCTCRKKKCLKVVKIIGYTALGVAAVFGGYKLAQKKGWLPKKNRKEGLNPNDVVGFAIIEEDKYYPRNRQEYGHGVNWSSTDRQRRNNKLNNK